MPVVCCLDIETTGLDKHAGVITVISIALYDSQRKRTIQEFEFNACVARETSSDEEDDLKLHVKTILNGSERLVAYNGIHFDIPWLAHWIDASNVDLLETWKGKTIDFLHEAKVRINRYIGMDHVASVNAIAISKIATGKQAVEWAREKNWYVLFVLCVIHVQNLTIAWWTGNYYKNTALPTLRYCYRFSRLHRRRGSSCKQNRNLSTMAL